MKKTVKLRARRLAGETHATDRLASRMPGLAEWQACNAARSYGRQIAKLRYHLLGITPDSIHYIAKSIYLYIS